MENIEQIHEQAKKELESLKTEQAVRLEKVKTQAAKYNLQVDANLPNNANALREQKLTEKSQFEAQLEAELKKLDSLE